MITPTRELAQQIGEAVRRYGATSSLEAVVVHGGTRMGPEIAELKFGCDVLIATPGRLLDYVGKGIVNLSYIEVMVPAAQPVERQTVELADLDELLVVVWRRPRRGSGRPFFSRLPCPTESPDSPMI